METVNPVTGEVAPDLEVAQKGQVSTSWWVLAQCVLTLICALVGGFLLGRTYPLMTSTSGVNITHTSRGAEEASVPTSGATPSTSPTTTSPTPIDAATCHWVGSKKSNKYHHPSTRCAESIKESNRICFDTPEEAKAKGYVPGCM